MASLPLALCPEHGDKSPSRLTESQDHDGTGRRPVCRRAAFPLARCLPSPALPPGRLRLPHPTLAPDSCDLDPASPADHSLVSSEARPEEVCHHSLIQQILVEQTRRAAGILAQCYEGYVICIKNASRQRGQHTQLRALTPSLGDGAERRGLLRPTVPAGAGSARQGTHWPRLILSS